MHHAERVSTQMFVWEGAPEDEEAILQVIKKLFQVPPGESISPTPNMQYNEEKIARRKREHTKLQLQDDMHQFLLHGPSSNSDINTESLLNK